MAVLPRKFLSKRKKSSKEAVADLQSVKNGTQRAAEKSLPFYKFSGARLPSLVGRGHSSTESSPSSSQHSSTCGSPSSDGNPAHSPWTPVVLREKPMTGNSADAAACQQEESPRAPPSLLRQASAPAALIEVKCHLSAPAPPIDRQSSAPTSSFTCIPKSPIYRQPFYVLKADNAGREGMEEEELVESDLTESERWRLLADTHMCKEEIVEEEREMDFYHRQLQLLRINQPAGLDHSFCFKWQPSLESIVEFEVDYMPKIAAMPGGNLLRMATALF